MSHCSISLVVPMHKYTYSHGKYQQVPSLALFCNARYLIRSLNKKHEIKSKYHEADKDKTNKGRPLCIKKSIKHKTSDKYYLKRPSQTSTRTRVNVKYAAETQTEEHSRASQVRD